LAVGLATGFDAFSITVSFTFCLFLRRTFSRGLKTPFSYIALMALAMSDLAGSIVMHESKSIDRLRFCQIHRSYNGQTIKKKNREADRTDTFAGISLAGESGDQVKLGSA
jgi:hypothetical protein